MSLCLNPLQPPMACLWPPSWPPPAPQHSLLSAPVACIACAVRIAEILLSRLQAWARILGDPGKHTLLRGHGQVTESRPPRARAAVLILLPALSCLLWACKLQSWDKTWSQQLPNNQASRGQGKVSKARVFLIGEIT